MKQKTVIAFFVAAALTASGQPAADVAPIYGIKIPDGYRARSSFAHL